MSEEIILGGEAVEIPKLDIEHLARCDEEMNNFEEPILNVHHSSTNENTEALLDPKGIIEDSSSTVVSQQVDSDMATSPNRPSSLSQEARREMVEKILETKTNIDVLLKKVRDTRATCERYEKQNKLLQDYVGSLMSEI